MSQELKRAVDLASGRVFMASVSFKLAMHNFEKELDHMNALKYQKRLQVSLFDVMEAERNLAAAREDEACALYEYHAFLYSKLRETIYSVPQI